METTGYLTTPGMMEKVKEASITVAPSPTDTYPIHGDGGMIYNPISKEKAAELTKYDGSEVFSGVLSVPGATLAYSVPKNVTAYDAVPVRYTLKADDYDSPIHIEASAAEDQGMSRGQKWYDNTLPGHLSFDFELIGYRTAKAVPGARPVLSYTMGEDRQGKRYPCYDLSELVRSGTVPVCDFVWFLIGYTYTGDTVLDGNGGGTFNFEPVLWKKNEEGSLVRFKKAENLFYRIEEELYPGEKKQMWITFDPHGITEGDYQITINCLLRNETINPESYFQNIWHGENYCTYGISFSVTKEGGITEVPPFCLIRKKEGLTRNRWLHKYEEFMTSFDSWLKPEGVHEGVLYVQPAPWSEQIVLRLIKGDEDLLDLAALPVKVESDSVKVRFNPDNMIYRVMEDGTRYPVIQAQSMADMRGNIQQSPFPADYIVSTFRTMQEIGINVINTTAAFQIDLSDGRRMNNNIDAFWFSADAARLMGLKMEGFVRYPFDNSADVAKRITGMEYPRTGFGTPSLGTTNGIRTLYQTKRWGNNFWVTEDGVYPLSLEDTRGWERVDFNARYPLSPDSLRRFRLFCEEIYGDIAALNAAWGSRYDAFDAILPEEGTTDDHGYRRFYHHGVFGEWSRALADLDSFRTLERLADYRYIMDEEWKEFPEAKLNLRTEGANWIAKVDPATANPHYRHVYYSQRRCGIHPDLMAGSDMIYAHSDYTTLPYTPSEVTDLTKRSLALGFRPVLLPQFDRMRDIAVNEVYGCDFTYDYNLSGATKGVYINTVCSLFEWFRATYEAGGAPGILWQDYLCDGYATSVQKKEIAFFARKLREAVDTPEGQAWAHQPVPSDHVEGADERFTFDPAFVAEVIGRNTH